MFTFQVLVMSVMLFLKLCNVISLSIVSLICISGAVRDSLVIAHVSLLIFAVWMLEFEPKFDLSACSPRICIYTHTYNSATCSYVLLTGSNFHFLSFNLFFSKHFMLYTWPSIATDSANLVAKIFWRKKLPESSKKWIWICLMLANCLQSIYSYFDSTYIIL